MTTISHFDLASPRPHRATRTRVVPAPPTEHRLESDQLWIVLLATAGWLAMAAIAALLVTGAWSPLDPAASGDNPAATIPRQRPSEPATTQPLRPQPHAPRPRAPQPD